MKHCYLLILAFTFLPFIGQGQILGENMIDNFETTTKLDYQFATGVLDSGVANTVSGGLNTSARVAKYVRNPGVQFDVIVANPKGGNFQGIASYVSNAKKFVMKCYTDAPVGSSVQLTIQNSAQSLGGYPQGRHSVYIAPVTASNTWINLVFNFDNQPVTNVDPATLDEIVISFNNNSQTGFTYYFDELAGPAIGAAPVVPNNEYVWSNFNRNNNIRYKGSDGTLTKDLNPARSASHVLDSAAKYVRSGVQYDVLRFGWVGPLRNLTDYRANTKKFSLNVFSPAAGTTIQFTLQDSVAALGAYPTGRFGEFTGRTTVNGGWERVTLTWANTPDAAVTDARVNELAILFNSNTFVPVTIFMDTIFGPSFGPTALKAKQLQDVSVSPNPASDFVDVSFPAVSGGAATVDVLDLQGRIVRTENITANSAKATHRVATEGLLPSVYHLRVRTPQGIAVQKLVIR